MHFSINDYQSDGPGFTGQVDISYSALTRSLVIKAGGDDLGYVLPSPLPRFVRVLPNSPDVAQQAFAACSGGDYEPGEFSESRIVTLEFVGGLLGYFIVFGEPCYAALAVGKLRFAIQEEDIKSF